ncbi:hypothetical protein AURDEDRAFT_160716 [Auricularia subglabra TFB-10046 SS5]|nr:hypothetical protein AURDEDRAFT_160716 [Auricularia subglabra TFB-10046 SS5]
MTSVITRLPTEPVALVAPPRPCIRGRDRLLLNVHVLFAVVQVRSSSGDVGFMLDAWPVTVIFSSNSRSAWLKPAAGRSNTYSPDGSPLQSGFHIFWDYACRRRLTEDQLRAFGVACKGPYGIPGAAPPPKLASVADLALSDLATLELAGHGRTDTGAIATAPSRSLKEPLVARDAHTRLVRWARTLPGELHQEALASMAHVRLLARRRRRALAPASNVGATLLSNDAHHVIELVRLPAPILRTLRIYICVDGLSARSRPVLPADLLGGNSTSLETVFFDTIDLPPFGFRYQFPNLTDVAVGLVNYAAPDTLGRLRAYFPACSQLTLSSPMTFSEEICCDLDFWSHIQKLEIGLHADSQVSLLHLRPIENVPTVRVFLPSYFAVWKCISHLSGSLQMTMREEWDGTTSICMRDTRNHCRAFVAYWTTWVADYAYYIFDEASLIARITELTLPSTRWAAMSQVLFPFDRLIALRLVLEDDSAIASLAQDRAIVCPRLRVLAIRCCFDVAVLWRADIAAFARAATERVPGRLVPELRLENVLLQGEDGGLSALFGTIVLTGLGSWRWVCYCRCANY